MYAIRSYYAIMDTIRQLAAIMFTDMEGYTALMQKDEQAAIERRSRHREVFEESMSKHGGRIIQYYGDGTLSIFSSAIHAVMAGVEMQLLFRKSPQVPLRIGIHTGDITRITSYNVCYTKLLRWKFLSD